MTTPHDIDIARAAWRAERLDELHSDTTALVDAVIELHEPHTLLGDLIDALRGTEGDTPADRLILRVTDAELAIERVISFIVDQEDARGRWSSYVFEREAA